jgi:TonB family protein
MEVSDVLRDRMQQPSGLQRMLTLSIGVHAAFAAAIIFAPGGLLQSKRNPPVVMTISLGGGGVGPENGGMTTMGGRPIQQVKPPDEPPKREAVRPPAAAKPEMTMPLPKARATKTPPSPAVKDSAESRGRTPTKGDKITPGSTPADTGVRGQGFGLSTGGGAGSGSSLDVKDFCCPEYITTMVVRIRAAWNQNQGATGQTLVKFTIQRDGSIRNAEVENSAGSPLLDNAALRAVLQTRTLPPLPDPFPNPTLTVHLNFQYQ